MTGRLISVNHEAFFRINSLRVVLFLPLFIFLLSGCTTVYNPATEKKEIIFINTAREIDLGREMDKEIRRKFKIVSEPALNNRLERIGQRVASTSDRKDIPYYFSVIKDEELNAFTIPGGFVYVNKGLMDAANNDELACVLAHEIGHLAARHSVKRLQAVLGYQIIIGIALGVSGASNVGSAMDVIFNVVNLGYSRSDEDLADRLAVRYARRSGFNPQGMVTFFQKLQREAEKKGGSSRLAFLSSHPPLEKRIENVKNEISMLEERPR